MSEGKDEFGLSLFGYNKGEVCEYISNTKTKNEKKLKELENKLKSISVENMEISMKLKELKVEMKQQMKPDETMNYILNRAYQVLPLINKAAAEELSKITLIGKKQEVIFNSKIDEYNNIIKANQERLDSLLRSELEKNEDLIENVKKFIEQSTLYNEIKNKDIQEDEEITS